MKLIKWLDHHFEETVLTVLLGLIAVIMLAQVVMRYLFRSAMSWPEEVCRYLYIWSCFIGISYCINSGSELRIDLAERMLKGKSRRLFAVALQAVCLGFYLYIGISSAEVYGKMLSTGQTSPAARIPMHLVYLAVPVSMALAGVRCVQKILRLSLDGFGKGEKNL